MPEGMSWRDIMLLVLCNRMFSELQDIIYMMYILYIYYIYIYITLLHYIIYIYHIYKPLQWALQQ